MRILGIIGYVLESDSSLGVSDIYDTNKSLSGVRFGIEKVLQTLLDPLNSRKSPMYVHDNGRSLIVQCV